MDGDLAALQDEWRVRFLWIGHGHLAGVFTGLITLNVGQSELGFRIDAARDGHTAAHPAVTAARCRCRHIEVQRAAFGDGHIACGEIDHTQIHWLAGDRADAIADAHPPLAHEAERGTGDVNCWAGGSGHNQIIA